MAHTETVKDTFTDEEMAVVATASTTEQLYYLRDVALRDLAKIDAEIIKALRPLMHRRRQIERTLLVATEEQQRRRATP